VVEIKLQIYLLGDLDLLLDLFAGLTERRARLGLTDLEGDRERERPPRLGGDLLGGDLLRGGDLPLYPPLGGDRLLGGLLLQLLRPPPRLNGGGGPRLRGDKARLLSGDLLTARVVGSNLAAIRFPSICPPSKLIRAFSASSCFSNSTYPNPRGKSTFLSHATSTLFRVPNVPKISSK